MQPDQRELSNWSLRAANAAESRILARAVRRFGITTTIATLILVLGATVGLTDGGLGEVTPLVVVAVLLANLMAIQAARRTWARPLEDSVVAGTYMANHGLVDEEGRLTTLGKEALVSAPGAFDPDLIGAVHAFQAASRLHLSGRRWTTPFAEFTRTIDTREIRARLEQEARHSRRAGS